jgi:hypothetical protein
MRGSGASFGSTLPRTWAESDAVLQFLFRHVETRCCFRWQQRSVAFWDNRCVQHHAMWDYLSAAAARASLDYPGRQAVLPSLSGPPPVPAWVGLDARRAEHGLFFLER